MRAGGVAAGRGNRLRARRRRGGAERGVEAGRLHVLKFGSSVLRSPADYARVAAAVGAEIACDRKVVAVASAMGDATDSLLAAARAVTARPPERLVGALLATGEEASVALLTLALAAAGVEAVGLNARRTGIRTRGPLADADPVAIDAGRIRRLLRKGDAVVLPGFVGVDGSGAPSLLGRGGSDLTALFVGHALGAAEIRLVKDVDGVFSSDPRAARCPAPLATLTWEQAREIGGGVVQPKALDFAERRGLRFRVTGLGGRGTTVGKGEGWSAPC